jgi:glycosyltransferase involved in cell wall biosynthesis
MKPFLIDGYKLPFADGSFDVVYMRHVLEHQTHYRYLLAEMCRVCRGEIFVTFFIPLSDAETDDIQFDGTWHNNRYARAPFYAFARQHGFEPREIASFHYDSGYADDLLMICTRIGAGDDSGHQVSSGPARPQTADDRQLTAVCGRSKIPRAKRQGRPSVDGRLTILFASQHYPAPGQPTEGIGDYVITAARALAARSHDVHILTCAHPGQPSDWSEAGVTIHQIELPGPNAKDPEQIRAYSQALAERVQALDAVHHFDVVEFQEWAAEGWAFHPRADQLLVVRTQTPSWVVREFEYADGDAAERQIDELERWPLERADVVTAPSRLAARRLAERWAVDPAAAVIIPNAVDTDQFRAPAPRPPAPLRGASRYIRAGMDEPGFGDSRLMANSSEAYEPLVLCVNRYTPLKGVEQFVRAAAIVHRRFPSARFRLVGRNGDWNGQPADQYLRELAWSLGLPADRIEIPGPVPREALPAEYAAADVGVNPSLYENVSHTAIELLSCGRPAILTSGQGNTEYMSHGDDCLIVPPGDVEQLADAMLTLLNDPEMAQRLGEAARRTTEARLSATAVAAQLETTYRQGLAQIARRPAAAGPARLNVAILTHNALDYTQKCLASLFEHTPEPLNIFVLDNASEDGTPEWLAAQTDSRLHVLCSPANLGVAGGRNRLIREILPHLQADGFIVLLDNDVEVYAGWYQPFLALFEPQGKGELAGGLVGQAGDEPGKFERARQALMHGLQ